MRALIILFLTIINCCTYGETICFLLTEKGNNKCYNDSFVIQLSKPEDIAYARRMIAEPNNPTLFSTVIAIIVPGADGINRNYLAPGAPEWSWHAKFLEFAYCSIPEGIFAPTEIEWDLGWIQYLYGGIVCFGYYRITAELGPILEVSIVQAETNISVYWADLNNTPIRNNCNWGTKYQYTLENRASISETWKPLSGTSWPKLTNQWSFPKNNTSGFYRVKAQLLPSPGWPSPYFGGH